MFLRMLTEVESKVKFFVYSKSIVLEKKERKRVAINYFTIFKRLMMFKI